MYSLLNEERLAQNEVGPNSLEMRGERELCFLKGRRGSATLRVPGSLQQLTEVMKAMQELVKLFEISKTTLSQEMMKTGIIEEMLKDTMGILELEKLEEEAQQEVDKPRDALNSSVLGSAELSPASPQELAAFKSL
ncbi:charged multivesicular body protein 3-like [Palaemon carinicauda]|uniref:charged multivesicular body protein 3-like n=1 Tax=Palaemon carinicauda TaxID=392227 RepID=UPI0035B611B9